MYKCTFNDSIPDYHTMRKMIYQIGSPFVKGGTLIDLGCSKGDSFRDFVNVAGKIIGTELSPSMIKACRSEFKDRKNVTVEEMDITIEFPTEKADLILSVLTVQFTPLEHRQKILSRVYDSLKPGGAFIFVEKVIGSSFMMDDLFSHNYLYTKSENKYTDEDVSSKEQSPEGVLVPVTYEWNENLLKSSGFTHFECFWRCLNFCGWVAVK